MKKAKYKPGEEINAFLSLPEESNAPETPQGTDTGTDTHTDTHTDKHTYTHDYTHNHTDNHTHDYTDNYTHNYTHKPDAGIDTGGELRGARERRSARLNLLLAPSTLDELKTLAQTAGISVNDAVNQILIRFLSARRSAEESK